MQNYLIIVQKNEESEILKFFVCETQYSGFTKIGLENSPSIWHP